MNSHHRVTELAQGDLIKGIHYCLFLLLVVSLTACSAPKAPATASAAFPSIDGNAVLQHVKVLSSDEYEGRAPGTKGEDLSIAYIEGQFKKAGLKPGNTDGIYIQKVPLVGITADPSASLTFKKGNKQQVLRFKDDFVAWTKRVSEDVKVDASGT